MDCGNFCIQKIYKKEHITKKYNTNFIFSEVFPGVSLLPKIGIELLMHFQDVQIIHEYEDIFLGLKKEELPLLDEYKKWLNVFIDTGGKYNYGEITIDYIGEMCEHAYCIMPIKKDNGGEHFILVEQILHDEIIFLDNKKAEYKETLERFKELTDLYNGKYILFCENRKAS